MSTTADAMAAIDLDDAVELALTGARRIAMVGASDDPESASSGVMAGLLERGYDVVPVNPTTDAVLGVPTHPDLASVPGRIDVVDVFRAPEHLPDVARAAVAREDVGVVWNQLGLASADARRVVRDAGRGYVEDRCMEVESGRPGVRPPVGPRLEHPVVLLDLDDTLLDHVACERAAASATLAAFDLTDDDRAVATYARHNADLWELYRSGGVEPAALRTQRWDRTLRELEAVADVDAVSAHYLEAFEATGAMIPRSAEALWWLGRRARVAIVTNGFREVQTRRLAATGLDRLVDVFVSSEEAGIAKPDPAALHLALDRLGVAEVTADTVAVVGDQLVTDVVAGHRIGAHTVWIAPDDAVVPEGTQPPHVRARALADLA